MVVETVVKNGKIVSPGGIISGGIAIQDGKILAVCKDSELPEANKTIDAGSNYILPGIVDVHVHVGLYHPFEEDMKDVAAAAYAGTTTVGNYVGFGAETQKGSFDSEFDRWQEAWEKEAVVDAFFHGGILTDASIQNIKPHAQRYGITSYKFMMTCKGPEAEMIMGDTVDDGFLWCGFSELASLGYPGRAMVHAENVDIIYRIAPEVQAEGGQDLVAWDKSRPGFCETLDVERAISIAKATGAPLYIVHTSYADSVDVIARAQAAGIDIIGETCPQYLTLTKHATAGVLAKVSPPLRDETSIDRLWSGINEDTITCIGSDHCSMTKDMKPELWKSGSGAPGMEYLLPVMLSEGVNKGRITLEKLVEVLCYNNAKTFGIYPQKGAIQKGSDADLVIVDINKTVKLSAETDHYGVADFCPYEGKEVTGWPVLTMLRGKVVVEDGKMVANPGIGKYIPRIIN